MTDAIHILVVEDQTIVREGLCAMLATKPGLRVIGTAADGEEAVHRALALRPDVILMDLIMPRMDGIRATREIVAQWPAARILILTSYSDDAQIFEAFHAGALGFVLKQDVGQKLVEALQQIHAGQSPLNSTVTLRLMQSLAIRNTATPREATLETQLTERELEIARLVARGYDNQNIADALNISVRTVGTHVSNILRKAGVSNRTQLARLMLRQGLASLYE
ncbi:MAG TPA: response regulator transcription factor [Promineifilum sp.]|nr:response regulator transcription factor [Promineifilum sp.]